MGNGMQPVVRALNVLHAVGASRDGRSLSELSRELDLPLSTTHRLLRVLTDEGFVALDPVSRRHVAGGRLLHLVQYLPLNRSLPRLAEPCLRALNRDFDETVFLTELIGHRAVCVALVESSRALRITVGIGHEMPLHAAASARTLIAFVTESEVRPLLEGTQLTRYTADTPATVEEVLAHLRAVRRRGYDLCDNEFDANVWAASVPVRDKGRRVVAAVTLAAPAHRYRTAADRKRVIAAVRDAAATLERQAGHRD